VAREVVDGWVCEEEDMAKVKHRKGIDRSLIEKLTEIERRAEGE
jgi:hypothetical protein